MSFFRELDKDTRRIVNACFFAFLLNGLSTMMMGSLMPDMKLAYGLSDTQSGLMLSGHSLGNLLAGFFSGLLPLWLGRRKSIVAISLLACVGYGMMILWGNPIFLIVAFVLTGVCRGGISNFNNSSVNRATNGNPAASNLLHCCFAVGAFSAPMIFMLASGAAGWRLAAGLIALLSMAVAFNYDRLRFEDDKPDKTDKTQSSMAFLKDPRFMVWAGMMFTYLCAEYSVNGWLVTFLQNKPALSAAFAASEGGLKAYSQTMATLLWLIILVGRLTCAALSKKLPQKQLMAIASVGVGLFLVLMLFSGSILWVTVAVAGLGFCMAGICPMIYSDASVVTNVYPLGTSTLLALGSIGAIITPAMVGALAERYGFTAGMGCILLAVIVLIALSCVNLFMKAKDAALQR